MAKREVVWLIIKLIAVYFIYEAVMSALSLIGSLFTLISLSDLNLSREISNTFLRAIVWAIAMTAFYGWIGWYLIKDGRLLFVILNREEPPPLLKNLEKDSINFSDKQNL